MIRPVFHEGELFGFVANVGHLAEIGGKAVGSLRRRRDRGLPGGPAHPAGQDRQAATRTTWTLWRLIMANHRTPRNTWGDLNAQIGSLRVAERRVHASCSTGYGREFVDAGAPTS